MEQASLSKRLLAGLIFLGILVGFLSITSDAQAFQIKRVLRGSVSFLTDDAVQVVDLTSELGGTNLDLTKTFVIITPDWPAVADNLAWYLFTAKLEDDRSITIQRGIATNAVNVEYTVVEFASGAIVRRGSSTFTKTGTSKTISIPTIDRTKTFPIVNTLVTARITGGNAKASDETATIKITFPSDNQMYLSRADSGYVVTAEYQIITFEDGTARVQYGETQMDSATTSKVINGASTPSISAVNATKSFVMLTREAGPGTAGVESYYFPRGEINDAGDTLTLTRAASGEYLNLSYYLVELKDASYVQRGLSNFTTTDTTKTVTLDANTDLNRTFAPLWVSGGSTSDDIEQLYVRANMSTGSLVLTRGSSGQIANVSYYVVQFPGITATYPNGTEVLRSGSTYNITWKNADTLASHPVTIKLSATNGTNIDSGTDFPMTIVANYDNASKGYYPWMINNTITTGNPISKLARIAIIDNVTLKNYDIGDGPFEIKGVINLTSPKTATTWYIGEVRPITWTKAGNFNYTDATFNISFSSNAGGEYNNSLNTSLACLTQAQVNCGEADDDCSFSWTVPAVFGTGYRVRVSLNSDSANVTDNSTQNFNITGEINLALPDGGQNWTVGDTDRKINWTKLGDFSASSFNISLYDDGVYNITIESNLAQASVCTDNNCSYSWNPIPDKISNKLKVRIAANLDPDNINDISTDFFNIKGSLSLTYPNGGQGFVTQTNETITWDKTGNWLLRRGRRRHLHHFQP